MTNQVKLIGNLDRILNKISTVGRLTYEEYGYLMFITDNPDKLSLELNRIGVIVKDSYKSSEEFAGC